MAPPIETATKSSHVSHSPHTTPLNQTTQTMSDPSLSTTQSSSSSSKTIADLDTDSLAHCASSLNPQDITNLAMTCKSLKLAAYSDSVWQRLFREHWPKEVLSGSLQASGVREAYLARRTALHQFKFSDPFVTDFNSAEKPFDHILLDKNDIIFSQGSMIQRIQIDSSLRGILSGHNARITSMRLFPLDETSLFQNEAQRRKNVLVTSSSDHSIRLWWKDSCQRCFRGHNGPVSALSDKLFGDGSVKLLASGGEDRTVRLWSLSSSGKGGQHALKATLYGHEKPVKLMSVAGHNTSLLVTMSRDSKVRVWDTSKSSAGCSSCCVGKTSITGAPVDMKCHESLLYVAAGSSVVAIDLRDMKKVITVANQPELNSFAILPSKFLICTGEVGKAMLWDARRSQDALKPEPMAKLDGHKGSVTLLHMDPYKIVTGGPKDSFVNIWETDTGRLTNSLICNSPEVENINSGCSAMTVNGYRIVTGSYNGLLLFSDFVNATCPVQKCYRRARRFLHQSLGNRYRWANKFLDLQFS